MQSTRSIPARLGSLIVLGSALALSTLSPAVRAGNPNDLRGFTVFATTETNHLISFDARRPKRIITDVAITGLREGETLRGIDFRAAAPGVLFAVGSADGTDRLYTVNPATGAATAVAGGVDLTPAISGSEVGFDFNPVVDRIRLVTDAEQNLRLHPLTGAVAAMDTPLAYASGDPNFGLNAAAGAAAYSNPDQNGLTGTTLYGIDTSQDVLVVQGSRERSQPVVSPNSGQLFTVGSLRTDASGRAGFDIVGDDYGDYIALAAFQSGGSDRSRLFSIDLWTGRARQIGLIGGKDVVTGLAIQLAAP